MQWSNERILTTQTGSLPRPPELTRLYVRRARGEAIDPTELDRVGKAALRRIVDKQVEAGVDIGNIGEQQREAFFLYVRRRMSGFATAGSAGHGVTSSAIRSSSSRWPRCSLRARRSAISSHPKRSARYVTSMTQS
jgi:methionine synthase II (cobalamin-independent)